MNNFNYVDFDLQQISPDISALFPQWQPGDERLMVLCPHDDDGVLGAGYAILAALANEAQVYMGIFCDGWAGYSHPSEAAGIIATRAAETITACTRLGLPADHVLRFNYPDFGLLNWRGWKLPGGQSGAMTQVLPTLRRLRITRLLLPNNYREHIDHEAAYQIGAYDGPQVGDAVIADLGTAQPIRSFAQYAVWGDLSPEDSLVKGRPTNIRANRAILTTPEVENRIGEVVSCWKSQESVIAGIMAARRANRVRNGRALELYCVMDARPALDFTPYHDLVDQIARGEHGY